MPGLPKCWYSRRIYKLGFVKIKLVKRADRCYCHSVLSLVVNLCFRVLVGLRYCQWGLSGDLVWDSTVVAAQRIELTS